MTNWLSYAILDGTLEALFSNGYNSLRTLKSITEEDLLKFREHMKIQMGQISLLRRFVGCLNCRQHPPVYTGAGEIDTFMGTGVGLLTSSAATSTTHSIHVPYSHETNPSETLTYDNEPLIYGVGLSTGNLEKFRVECQDNVIKKS